MKKLLFLIAGFLLLSFGVASAFPLFPSSGDYAPGTGIGPIPGTKFEDNNLDFFVDKDQNGLITVGDVLYSAIEFESIKENPFGSTYTLSQGADELVATAVIEVKRMENIGQSNERWWFGEYDDLDPNTDDSMVKFYTGLGDSNFDENSDISRTTAFSAVVDGATFLWSFSVDSNDPDTFWNFTPSEDQDANNPEAVRTLSSGTKVGTVNYALLQTGGVDIFNSVGLDNLKLSYAFEQAGSQAAWAAAGGDGLVDLEGSGDILGAAGRTNGAFATSDIDTLVNPIPEPATISLFGIGLLGLAAISRRRK